MKREYKREITEERLLCRGDSDQTSKEVIASIRKDKTSTALDDGILLSDRFTDIYSPKGETERKRLWMVLNMVLSVETAN